MSAIPVVAYVAGIFTFGFIRWLLQGMFEIFGTYSETGSVYDLILYFWAGALIVYLIFGGWYVIRLYNEQHYYRGI